MTDCFWFLSLFSRQGAYNSTTTTITIIYHLSIIDVCRWQLTDADQELYKNFPLVVSDRWQNEIAETVFEVVNQDADKVESKRRHRPRGDEPDEIGMILSASVFGTLWISLVFRWFMFHKVV